MELITVRELRKYYKIGLVRRPAIIRAVDGVSFGIEEGEICGLIGESGSGKTTIGRVLVGLIQPTSGKILLKGMDVTSMSGRALRLVRRSVQMIFQDPYDSLNPRMRVKDILVEPALAQGLIKTREEKIRLAKKLLADVKLEPVDYFLYRFPHELSGGQRQRVSIARALSTKSKLIIADEPVSMLDTSTRAEVLNSILDLNERYGVSFLYITHDIASAKCVVHRTYVMLYGKFVESSAIEDLVDEPLHPYTKDLISAVPEIGKRLTPTSQAIEGGASAQYPEAGCRYAHRCAYAKNDKRCLTEEPVLKSMGNDHYVACHLYS